jgi:RNA polymerase sigma factor (sigma-70 family)
VQSRSYFNEGRSSRSNAKGKTKICLAAPIFGMFAAKTFGVGLNLPVGRNFCQKLLPFHLKSAISSSIAMDKIPDEEIIQRLRSVEERQVDDTFVYLHRAMFQRMAKFVGDNSGSPADAKDLFQDALVVLFKMARQEKLPEGVVVEAYLFSICRNLWYKVLNKRKRTSEWTEAAQMEAEVEPPLTSMLSEERRSIIERLFAKMGEDCKRLLVHYYFDQMALKEIAPLMNYASEQVAKNKKSFCMNKLKALAAAMPGLRELFNQ